MPSQKYRMIEHTADTGFEVRGGSREQVFASAAEAFFDIMWRIAARRETEPETVEATGGDLQELLVNFLEEFLYRYDAKGLVCTRLQVEKVTDTEIRSRAWLQNFDEEEDEELLSVKAVTYHQLFVGKENDTWTARIFVDI